MLEPPETPEPPGTVTPPTVDPIYEAYLAEVDAAGVVLETTLAA
jgi:hypothetical protein